MTRSAVFAAVLISMLFTVKASAAVRESIHPRLEAFPLSQVRLLDGRCKQAQEVNLKYLMSLDPDSLLRSFRITAGLPAPGKPLGGWESEGSPFRGHFIGHYLSACALMYDSTGNKAVKARADAVVSELAKCQKAIGTGYLSAFPEKQFDGIEAKVRTIPEVPYYVTHKIMAGLLDMYTRCGNKQALEVLEGMAAYFEKRMDRLFPDTIQWMLSTVEYGGMSEVLHDLYSITGDPKELKLAHTFDLESFLGPLAEGRDNLQVHGNYHLPIICGAARHYELTGDERYRKSVTYFWDRIANARSYASGGSTFAEQWGEPCKLAHTLAPNDHEACTTRNMMKVTQYLFRWTGDPKYADFYERAFLNGELGTQDPKGMLIGYLNLAQGFKKIYGTPTDSFWCCTGTGIEAYSKLADGIYYHDEKGIYVVMFVPSTVNWPAKNVRLEQLTKFPGQGCTRFIVHAPRPKKFALHIRVPYWAASGVRVRLNGKLRDVQCRPSSYITMDRAWREGDTVEVNMPMTLHAQPMPDDPDVMAVMYGPLVLAGLTHPEEAATPAYLSGYPSPDQVGFDDVALPMVEKEFYFIGDAKNLDSWIKPVPGKPLTFRTIGQPTDLTLIPLDKVVYERYGVYWLVTDKGSLRHQQLIAERDKRLERDKRIVDRVIPDSSASEAAHNLKGEKMTSGRFGARRWRQADSGGWWSWEMHVLPDVPMSLGCTYWGLDAHSRVFDVLVDGKPVAEQSLAYNRPTEFFEAEYKIPQELTKGKQRITVEFRPHEGNRAGRVFECVTLQEPPKNILLNNE